VAHTRPFGWAVGPIAKDALKASRIPLCCAQSPPDLSLSSEMPDGSGQSAIYLRSRTARDPKMDLRLNQTLMTWPGFCSSPYRMRALIMPERAGCSASPKFIQLLHYSVNRA